MTVAVLRSFVTVIHAISPDARSNAAGTVACATKNTVERFQNTLFGFDRFLSLYAQ
jgi:hypothetical protein